jgi:N-acetylglucosaminyldiphosphoundecaprenol N-acetyl-beta-D-mannosaminyltransferase
MLSVLRMEIEKVNVLGVRISVLDQDRAREFLFDAVRNGTRGYVTITNVHSVSEAQRDPELRRILNNALLATPDGMPLVWMGRLQKHPSMRRVYGPDLVLNLCEHSRSSGFSHFFLAENQVSPRNWRVSCKRVFRACELREHFLRRSGHSTMRSVTRSQKR